MPSSQAAEVESDVSRGRSRTTCRESSGSQRARPGLPEAAAESGLRLTPVSKAPIRCCRR